MLECNMQKLITPCLLLGMFLTTVAYTSEDEKKFYVGLGLGATVYADSGFARANISSVNEVVSTRRVGGQTFCRI